jgi:IS605 OrfB family transposase
LTDWIMGWHLPSAQSNHWNRNVGGLSLTRIATMKSLYQLHKAFAMRPRPDELRGAPEKGETNAGVAQSILDAMETMREQRVKQIASRIVEAALGVGIERDRAWDEVKQKWRYLKRPRRLLYYVDDQGVEHGHPRFKACHAVVIENLRNYRPDELQTRRENRALMTWSAGKVRKYLEEACQLHGLHLREVIPNYTSRQCSRTGRPGVRCDDVPVPDFLDKPWWRRAITRAKERKENPTKDKPYDAEAQLLVALDKQWPDRAEVPESERTAYANRVKCAKPIRLIKKGGDLFVAAPPKSCQVNGHRPCPLCDAKRGLQADLNAAANIGLRALLDPDFSGKWWYVPCGEEDGVPRADKVRGSACFGEDPTKFGSLGNQSGRRSKEITNFWADPSANPLRNAADHGFWLASPGYWKCVCRRVSAVLSKANGLSESPQDIDPR